jgi:transmembrane sensor
MAQLETGKLSSEDLAAFREWIQRSPRHFSEIRRVALIARQANVLAEMAEPLRSAAESLDLVGAPRRNLSPRWRMAIAAAAVIVVAGACALLLISSPPPAYVVATQIGAIKETRLSDGSIVKLNTDSRIEVTFTKAQRRVRLLKGEGFFEVAHNPDRPFIVYVGDRYVRAVGTAFAVRRTDNDLLVTVSEGRVEVNKVPASPEAASGSSPASGAATQARPKPLLIPAGHRLVEEDATGKDTVEMISNRELARDLSWRVGLLDFAGMPLSEVVREWSRYTDLKFEIADRDLQSLKFDGIFRTNEIGAFLDALEHSFGVDVDYVDDKTILLKHRATSPTGRT